MAINPLPRNGVKRAVRTAVWLALVIFVVGCRDDAAERQLVAWRQIEASERAGAHDEAPALLDSARTCYDLGLQLTAQENGRWFVLRDYAAADSHLTQAYALATRATAIAAENRRAKLAGLQNRIRRAQDRLDSLQSESRRHLMRMSLRRSLSATEVQLASAAKIVSESTLTETKVELDSAEDALAAITHALTNPFATGSNDAERWRQWVAETIEWSRRTDSSALVVVKRRHRAYVVRDGRVGPEFEVELGYGSAVNKRFAGDAATPEGRYRVTKRRVSGTRYYKALDLDYPNRDDKLRFKSAKKAGAIPLGVRIGGNIEIHGRGGRGGDWTNGCIALTDNDIDRLIGYLDVGSRVTIIRSIEGWPE